MLRESPYQNYENYLPARIEIKNKIIKDNHIKQYKHKNPSQYIQKLEMIRSSKDPLE